jgi:hypothetical protein
MVNRLLLSQKPMTWVALLVAVLLPACQSPQVEQEAENTSVPVQPASPQPQPSPTTTISADYALQEAEDKAVSAAKLTQTAQSQEDWGLAEQQLRRAIALLKVVPKSHPKYALAQQRLADYQRSLTLTQRRVKLAPAQATASAPNATDGIPLIAGGGEPEALKPENVRAAQSEARTLIGRLNRSQQSYYLEQKRFANSFEELKVSVNPETQTYTYAIQAAGEEQVITTATAKVGGLRSYTGAVYIGKTNEGEPITLAGICETAQPSDAAPETPTFNGNEMVCPAGSTKLAP